MTILHGVTGDTGPGDTEPRRVALRATSDGKLLVDGAGGGSGGGGLTEQETANASGLVPAAVSTGSTADFLERIADAAEDTSPVPTNILMGLGTARQLAAGSTSASQALTASGIVGISITAVGAAIRYNIGAAASATSHYLPEGQSRDIRVGASAVVHAMRAGSTDGVLEITELLA